MYQCYDSLLCRNKLPILADLHTYQIVFIFCLYLSLPIDISCFMESVNYLYRGEHPRKLPKLKYKFLMYNKFCSNQINTTKKDMNEIVFF